MIGLAAQEAPDGTQVLRLTGDLDAHTSGGLREPLLAHIGSRPHGPVEIDLTGLGYLSSSGVALLLEAAAGCTASRADDQRDLPVRQRSGPHPHVVGPARRPRGAEPVR